MMKWIGKTGKALALGMISVMLITELSSSTSAATLSQNEKQETTVIEDEAFEQQEPEEQEPEKEQQETEQQDQSSSSLSEDSIIEEQDLPEDSADPSENGIIMQSSESVNSVSDSSISENDIAASGVMPDDLIIPDLTPIREQSGRRSKSISSEDRQVGAVLPESYDSRNVNGRSYVTPVRNQAMISETYMCWAFSLMAAAEGDAMKEGIYGSTANFASPLHLANFMYHHVTDPLGGTAGSGTTQSNTNHYLGNTCMASLELMGWQGVGDEQQTPFTGYWPSGISDDLAYNDILHVTDAYWASAKDSTSIKNLIMEHGAVTTNVNTGGGINANHAAYYNGTLGAGHAITLVGWDDTFSKDKFAQVSPCDGTALTDGAWLVKDSYGTTGSNRDEGYYWLSYKDSAFLGRGNYVSNKAIALDLERSTNYDHNYQYDGSNGVSRQLYSESGTLYASNIFTAHANSDGVEDIEAVSFATPSVDGNYSVQIYTNVPEGATKPTEGTPAYTEEQTGSFTYAGAHTIKLNTPVQVQEGTRFAVVIKLTNGTSYNQEMGVNDTATYLLIDQSYDSGWCTHTASLAEKRGFYSEDGITWYDAAPADAAASQRATLRIKAYTNDSSTPEKPMVIEDEMVSELKDMEYTGRQLCPEPVIHYNEKLLVRNVDYTLTFGQNISVGKKSGVVTVRGIGKYTTKSPIVRNFGITRRNINSEGITFTGMDDLIYDGKEKTPIVVKDGLTILPETAYRISYSNNLKAGTATAVVKGVSNYIGTVHLTFTIHPRSLSDNEITYEPLKNYNYLGKAIEQQPIIKDGYRGNTSLILGTDVQVVYRNNIMPGISEVFLTGKGNYTGSHVMTFEIFPKDIGKVSLARIKNQTYQGGMPIRPEVIMKDGKRDLTDGVDFTTVYSNNTKVGTATISIAGKEGTIYEGSRREVTFEIVKVNLVKGVIIKDFGDCNYTVKKNYEQESMTLSLPNGTLLQKGVDYTVKYSNNTKVGVATMTITAASDGYTGTLIKTFEIVDPSSGKCINDYSDNKLEIKGFAYNREYMLNRDGRQKKWVLLPIEPEIKLYYNKKELELGKDYKLTYKNNVSVGTAKVIISAVPGSGYIGRREEEFFIVGTPMFVLGLPDNGFHVPDPVDKTYQGDKVTQPLYIKYESSVDGSNKPQTLRLKEGKHYKITYEDNINVGTASYIIEGMDRYSGKSKKYEFKVLPRQLSDLKIKGAKNVTYTGGTIIPDLHLQFRGYYLREGVDYDVILTDNVNAGTAKATFVVADNCTNFEGSTSVTFKINPKNLNALKVGTDITGVEDQVFDGTPKEPLPVITCNGNPISENDYKITYGKNTIGPGKNYVVIKALSKKDGGSGNFTGQKKIYYNILGKEIDVVSTYNGGEQDYTGKQVKPPLDTIETVDGEVLVRGKDYKTYYKNNRNCGAEAYILLKGRGDYTGRTAKIYFTIVPCRVNTDNLEVRGLRAVKLGNKAYVKPKFTVYVNRKKLKLLRDYTVTYTNNTKAGTGTVQIAFIGNYSGNTTRTFEIR